MTETVPGTPPSDRMQAAQAPKSALSGAVSKVVAALATMAIAGGAATALAHGNRLTALETSGPLEVRSIKDHLAELKTGQTEIKADVKKLLERN